MTNDPCNPVPDNTIPAGYTPPHHHAPHHVVGRIKHHIRHKFVHLGPPSHAPIPEGCEKHAITGPGYGHGAPGLPGNPVSKAAIFGGAVPVLVGLGGVAGFGGFKSFFNGFNPRVPSAACTKTSTVIQNGKAQVVCVSTPVPPTVPTPPITVTPPVTPTVPPTPPTTVPEPTALAVFLVGAAAVMLARHFHERRVARISVRGG